VLVLTSSGTADAADAAVAAIKSAGGTPAVVTILKPSLGMAPSAEATASESAPTTAPAEQTVAQAAAQLAAEWNGTNSDRTETSSLVHSGAIKISGLGDSTVAAQIIDVAAAGKSPDAAGLDIAQAYANAGMIAVGAQAYGADTGVAAAAAARKLSAFDTLGTNPGRFTLVALFSGGQQGYYSSNGHTALAFPPVPKP